MKNRSSLLTAALLGTALANVPEGLAAIPRRSKQPRLQEHQEEERRERIRKAEDKRFRKAVKQIRLYQKNLRIEAVAIRDETGKVWQLPPPARHHNVIHVMAEAGLPTPIRGEQGFVTSYGNFVDRKTAAIIATAAEQLKNGSLTIHYDLYSEDVW